MHEQIKALIQQRIAEARKDDITDKSMKILRTFGSKIISDNIDYVDDDCENEHDVKTAEDWSTTEIGLFYDYLSKGLNLQLKYDELNNELIITYNNDVVYWEVSGDIKAYVPMDIWKNKINDSVQYLKGKEKSEKKEQQELMKKEYAKQKNDILEGLRKFWGYQ